MARKRKHRTRKHRHRRVRKARIGGFLITIKKIKKRRRRK
jgi:hypothetical protein